jgi:hypothetical protein
MVTKNRTLGALTGLLVGTLAVQGHAFASCAQIDAAGSWQAYSIASSIGAGNWIRCRMPINAAGTIANNTCTDSLGITATMTGGKLTLTDAARCTFTGSFRLAGASNTIRHATMSLDKKSVEGVGTFPGGIFRFNLTKL